MEAPLNERPALAREYVVYNVAIGSNMDRRWLCQRNLGDGRRIRPLCEGVPCRVAGWALSFDLIVLPPTEPVMAGAVRRAGGVLHGVLWKLSGADYELLARTEACFAPGSPYVEREVTARPYDAACPPVQALIFALRRQPAAPPPHCHPSARYARMLLDGARAARLDERVVRRLQRMPTAPPCHPRTRAVARHAAVLLHAAYSRRRMLRVVDRWYRPLLATLYSRRQGAAAAWVAAAWNALLLAVLLPAGALGWLRALLLRFDVCSMAKGNRAY